MALPDFDRARAWLFDDALPFWAEVGVDRTRGGFHEALDLSGRPLPGGFRRLRVACRQIYAFSHGALLGWAPGLPLARAGFAWLVEKGWQGADRGWARRLTPEGEVCDGTPDLYDHAFVLFALAWLYRAGGDPEALTWAHRTLDFIERHLRHPSGRGYRHALPATGFRLQNPHMHFLEAALALCEARPEPRFRVLAEELVALFEGQFLDPRTGTVAEAYTEGLLRAPGPEGRVVEPGHQFEWAWLLGASERVLGRPGSGAAGQLLAFGERFGVNPDTGATYDQVRDDGVVLAAGSRTWPNTERIKAHVARIERDGAAPVASLTSATALLLDRYLAREPRGTWTDHFDGEGRPIAATIPAATLYHLVVAITELLRVESTVRAVGRRDERPALLAGGTA